MHFRTSLWRMLIVGIPEFVKFMRIKLF